jgi:hypothetical protein
MAIEVFMVIYIFKQIKRFINECLGAGKTTPDRATNGHGGFFFQILIHRSRVASKLPFDLQRGAREHQPSAIIPFLPSRMPRKVQEESTHSRQSSVLRQKIRGFYPSFVDTD